jgi:hypothetical protein
MMDVQTVEIDGSLVGILTSDRKTNSLHFHSGIAPYSLLEGSRFARAADAHIAVRRLHLAHNRKNSVRRPDQGDQP